MPANDIVAATAPAKVVSLAEEIRGSLSDAEPPDDVQDAVCGIVKKAHSTGVSCDTPTSGEPPMQVFGLPGHVSWKPPSSSAARVTN
jgi:hypothetical protein